MEKADEILKRFFKENDFTKNNKYSHFFNYWESLVGDQLYGHSRIIDISMDILIIEVDHPGCVQLFKMKEKQILSKIKKKYPEIGIKSIKFKVKFKALNEIKREDNIKKPNNNKKTNVNNSFGINENDTTELNKALNKLYNSVLKRQL